MPHIYTYKSIPKLRICQKVTTTNRFMFWYSDKMLLSAITRKNNDETQ